MTARAPKLQNDGKNNRLNMLDTRTFTRYVVIVFAVGATALVIWTLSTVLLLIFAGIVMATALRAMAAPLTRRLHVPERWAVLIVVLLVIGALVGMGALFGAQVNEQMSELFRRVPEAAAKLRGWVNQTPLGGMVNDAVEKAGQGVSGAIQSLTRFASTTLGALANVLLIAFLALYLALEPRRYLEGALRLVPLTGRDNARDALLKAGRALRNWLLGQGIAMLAVGIATGIGLAIAGVPLALALGILAGIFDFVPIVGPIFSAIPGILIGFSVSPETALWATVVYIVVQQLEGNIIMPIAQRWAVALPPAIGLISVVAFGLLFGVLGVLFATPLAVVTMVLVRELYVKDVLESPEAHAAANGQ